MNIGALLGMLMARNFSEQTQPLGQQRFNKGKMDFPIMTGQQQLGNNDWIQTLLRLFARQQFMRNIF